MDFVSLKDVQSGLGTGVVIFMDKSTDIAAAISRFSHVRLLYLAGLLNTHYVYSFINTSLAGSVLYAEKAQRS